MTREELKEILSRIIDKLQEPAREDAPPPACIFNDAPCDVTTRYAVNEEG